jgi:SP family sugar:H+ symporter-like MFS transporter
MNREGLSMLSAPPQPSLTVQPSRAHAGYVTFLAGTAALGGFLFGFDSAVINGTVGGLQRAFASSTAGTGFAVASILLGCAAGALVAGRLADRVGRRLVMIGCAIVFAVTAVWAGHAGTATEFTVARLASGVAVGAASLVCPAYIAEISPAQWRGRLASLQQLGIVIGIFAALQSDEWLARIAGGVSAPLWGGSEAWRWMFYVEVAPSVLFGVAVLAVPESPRYLVASGRESLALAILRRIDPSTPDSAVEDIRRTVQADRPPRLADLRDPAGGVRLIVWIGAGLAVLQQLVGINTIFYYGSVLWSAAGFTQADSLKLNVVTGGINVASTLVAMAVVDRVGRRPLLLWGSAGMAVTLGALAFAFHLGDAGAGGTLVLSGPASALALAAANLYVIAFGVSWGPCVWVLLGEMFPNRIRGAAMAVTVLAMWMANWLVTVTFPPIVDAMKPSGAYAVYFAFAVVSFFFVSRWVSETRGKTLEEM